MVLASIAASAFADPDKPPIMALSNIDLRKTAAEMTDKKIGKGIETVGNPGIIEHHTRAGEERDGEEGG